MGHIIKNVLKILLVLAIICGLGFIAYRYKELKEAGKLEEVFASNSSSSGELDPSTFTDSSSSSSSTSAEDNNSENNEETKTDDRQFVVEEKDYEGYYNKFIFDNTLLLYEGNQTSSATLELVNRLIQNVDDPMYSKPTVVLENIGGLSANEVNQNDFEQYKQVLNEFKNVIGNSKYNISFEYAKFSSMVNKIIITKK
ncbi:MAG: hypothetical protein IJW20_07540 [Clostridia bacterium]|nr:hypothetical protein [Clostridia bacterium]